MQNSRQTEVAEFDVHVTIEEDVGGFEVAMQHDLAVLGATVTLLQSEQDLRADLPNNLLVNSLSKTDRTATYTDVHTLLEVAFKDFAVETNTHTRELLHSTVHSHVRTNIDSKDRTCCLSTC